MLNLWLHLKSFVLVYSFFITMYSKFKQKIHFSVMGMEVAGLTS